MELAAGEMQRAKALLGKTVSNHLDPELWQFYVDFVKSSRLVPALKKLSQAKGDKSGSDKAKEAVQAATKAADSARTAVSKAFEAAIDKVGLLPGSDSLWDAWIDFAKGLPAVTEFETAKRRESLRGAYKRALAAPTARVASGAMWTDYEEFEKENSQASLTASLLGSARIAFATATAAAKERAPLWAAVNPRVIPVQPRPADPSLPEPKAHARVTAQVAPWRAFLDYEARNPLRLTPPAHASLMRSHLKRCLLSTRCLPHFWQELAVLELRVGGVLRAGEPVAALADRSDAAASKEGAKACQMALKVLSEGVRAAPHSEALAMSAADTAELLGDNRTAGALYQQASTTDPGPALWIAWIRFARRTGSADASRRVFVAAKKQSSHPALFLAAADMEAACNGDRETAMKILDLGRKKMAEAAAAGRQPEQEAYAVAACRLATTFADAANSRSLFEAFLADLPPGRRGPLMALYVHFETRGVDGGGDIRRLARLETRCLHETGSLPSAARWAGSASGVPGSAVLAAQAYRWQSFGLPPSSGAADVTLFSDPATAPLAFRTSDGGVVFGSAALHAASGALGTELQSGTPLNGPGLDAGVVPPMALSGAAAPSGVPVHPSAARMTRQVAASAAATPYGGASAPAAVSSAPAPPTSRVLDGQVAAPIPQPAVPVHPSLLRAAGAAASAPVPAAPRDPAKVAVTESVPAVMSSAVPRGSIVGPALTRLCVAVSGFSLPSIPGMPAAVVAALKRINVPQYILKEAATDERLMQSAFVGGVPKFMALAEAYVSHSEKDPAPDASDTTAKRAREDDGADGPDAQRVKTEE